MKKRVLSGIRASGRLHLGNYFGMVKGMLTLQENPEYEVFFMVADLHATTTPFDPKKLKDDIYSVVLDYLAAGLDPEKASVFIQSHVPAHSELAFLFSTVISVARMNHLPTYKEKVKQYPKNVTMALLNYPVLMAADILAYKTSELPVGDDQLPHLEVAREVAKKMNEKYGLDFPEPKQLKTQGHYVPSLTGEGKMSKSVEGSYINLADSFADIKKKVRSIPTSSVVGGEMTPGLETLFKLFDLFLPPIEVETIRANYKNGKLMYMQAKDRLAEAIYEELKPIQERRKKLKSDPSYVKRVIEQGAEKARKVASQTVKEVKEKMGLL